MPSSTFLPHESSIQTGSGLQRLLGATDIAAFLRAYLGEQMVYVSGAPDRWSDLFSWQELNAILGSGFVSVPRVRLVSKGTVVDAKHYSNKRGEHQWPDSQRVQELMAQGATLILTNIENVNSRLNTFVRELERDLNARVRVDVVATCASVPGLNMHWDNAECFNLQLDGEKHWVVKRPERPYPLTSNSCFPNRADAIKATAPEADPTWERAIVPGDLLYLPRGWWHAVTPRVLPSLHLSIAVDIPTLQDFLQWFAVEASRQEFARRSLPVWQAAASRRQALGDLLVSLKDSLSPDILESFLTHFAEAATTRPDYALPAVATPGAPRLDGHTAVRLRSSRPLGWTLEGDLVSFQWHGQPYRFHVMLLPALRKLETMRAFTLDELSDGVSRLLVRACILALMTAGLVNITERVDPS